MDKFEIGLAGSEHISELKKLWKDGFEDSIEYIDFFFENKFNDVYAVTVFISGKPIGVCYLLPVSTIEYGVLKNGYYLYAVSVMSEYRGKGIGSNLLKTISKYAIENNKFLILCPADEALQKYYSNLGFIENAYVSEKIYCPTPFCDENFLVSELTAERLEAMRNLLFDNIMVWNKKSLEYVLKENIFTNGKNLLIEIKGKTYYAVIKAYDNHMVVSESDIPPNERQKVSNWIGLNFKINEIRWLTPHTEESDSCILYGMSFNLKKDNYYLNHILN